MITYSKIIVFLKIVFFVASLSILGILFIISPPDKFGEPVKVSTRGLEKNIAYQIIGAKLRGASETGHRFDFEVGSIDPHRNNPEEFAFTNLNGTLSIHEKDIYNISAKKAHVSSNESFVDLIGDLNIKTKSGISGKSQKVRLDWDSDDKVVSSKVELTTPIGRIYGGTMRISTTTLSDRINTRIEIVDGVKLIYEPDELEKIK